MPTRSGPVLVVALALGTVSPEGFVLGQETPPAAESAESAQSADDRFDAARQAFRSGNVDSAVKTFRELAEQGHPHAQAVLGDIYVHGDGVPSDPKKGAEWYRKAAEQGFAPAQVNLGVCYEKGVGVPKDLSEAVRWYRWAAFHGNSMAQRFLGDMLARGEGAPKDWKEAEVWFGKAAAQGEPQAETLMKIPDAKRQAAFERAAKPAKTTDRMLDAMRVVELDDQIFYVKFLMKNPMNLQVGNEKITQETAPAFLARLEAERAELLYPILRGDSARVAGDYALTEPATKKCAALPDGALAYPVTVRVVQSEHAVELRGKGIAGCGYLVGNVLVLKAQKCEGTAMSRFLAVAKENAIEGLTYYDDGPSRASCSVGTLKRVAGTQ